MVFGAGGQLGCEIMAMTRALDLEAIGVTHKDADVTSFETVARALERSRPRLVVNAAAYTAVDRAEAEPDIAEAVNAVGAKNVARAAAMVGVPMVHLSTDYVFNGTKRGPYLESDMAAPLGVYGLTKLKGETLVQAANKDAIIVRTAWVYSRYGSNFLKTILRLAATHDRLRIVADQHGCPTSTMDIAEAVLAIDNALREKKRSSHRLFHFVGSGSTTWHGFAKAIVEYQAKWTQRRPRVDPIATSDYPTAAQRPANSQLDATLFEQTFGYRARPWQERVKQAIDSLLETSQQQSGA